MQVKNVLSNKIYYDISNTLTYNALFYFIIGERGVGKTYSAKKFCIRRFLKTGEQFVYLRRYKTELSESVGDEKEAKFFKKIKSEFPDHKFKVSGDKLYCDNKICGYALSLSTALILKSAEFDKVKTIIFDEFIIDGGSSYHYFRNEVEQFLEFYESIARLRDVRVLFLANAISITNPYFTYFNITLPYGNKNIKTFKDGLILIEYIKNLVYREVKKKSKFGRIIEGTKYSEYAIDNKFLRDNKSFIKKKDKKSKFFFIVVYNSIYYGVWRDFENGSIFISKDYDPKCPILFSFTPDDHNEKTIYTRFNNNGFLKSIVENYRLGNLFFENQQIKNIFSELILKHITY